MNIEPVSMTDAEFESLTEELRQLNERYRASDLHQLIEDFSRAEKCQSRMPDTTIAQEEKMALNAYCATHPDEIKVALDFVYKTTQWTAEWSRRRKR